MKVAVVLAALIAACSNAAGAEPFELMDVFDLEYATDPRLSPNGQAVVYVRNFMDKLRDRRRSNLWIIARDGSGQRPLTMGSRQDASPRWSPDGKRLVYAAVEEGSTQIYCRWMDTGQTAQLTSVESSPNDLTWSPDGRWLAFSMFTATTEEPLVKLPKPPRGAEWAEPPKLIRKLRYRADGSGYVKPGYRHLYVLPAEGGTPRQITSGDFHHSGNLSWTADATGLIFSANRHADWEYRPRGSEIYEVTLADGTIRQLTEREGPDTEPVLSPDGKTIAYVGYDDRRQGYQVSRLYIMQRDGGRSRTLAAELDRSIRSPLWNHESNGLYFLYDDFGTTKIGFVSVSGNTSVVAEDVGGVTIGRPYASGSFSIADDGTVAFTQGNAQRPADVAITARGAGQSQQLTHLNDDLLDHKQLGEVEELRVKSFDKRTVQAWIIKPPGFDPSKKYPLILEIHGGPFANYGNRFAAELQLYAANGYVVLYVNPRGSTGYGEEFGNLIHHAYPGRDYDDLMAAVDAVIQRGFVDPDNLFVTGGSGGGVLTAWIVGKTNRFRAAVSAKPVINWYSFALTSDGYPFFVQYWFPGPPWEHAEHYLKRSPLSLVGNVQTPTMLLTGEDDYRTPISESEQFYQALKLRKVDTALVRIPGASHGIAQRPSHMMAKVAYVLKWFEMHAQ